MDLRRFSTLRCSIVLLLHLFPSLSASVSLVFVGVTPALDIWLPVSLPRLYLRAVTHGRVYGCPTTTFHVPLRIATQRPCSPPLSPTSVFEPGARLHSCSFLCSPCYPHPNTYPVHPFVTVLFVSLSPVDRHEHRRILSTFPLALSLRALHSSCALSGHFPPSVQPVRTPHHTSSVQPVRATHPASSVQPVRAALATQARPTTPWRAPSGSGLCLCWSYLSAP